VIGRRRLSVWSSRAAAGRVAVAGLYSVERACLDSYASPTAMISPSPALSRNRNLPAESSTAEAALAGSGWDCVGIGALRRGCTLRSSK